MGNITNKGKIEDIFDNWDIPIIVKTVSSNDTFYKNKKAILDNTSDKLLIFLTYLNINCNKYTVYTNKLLFEKCRGNSFILDYNIETFEIKYHYISEYLCSNLRIYPYKPESTKTLRSFFNLFSKSSLNNFNQQIKNTFQLCSNKLLWNGYLYISDKYDIFQINAEVEYSNNSAIFHCSLSNIQHIVDKNIQAIHKTENVDFIPRNTDITLSEKKNNALALQITNYIKKWLNNQQIYNFFISPT